MEHCEGCEGWADVDIRHRLVTGHHVSCPNGRKVTKQELESVEERLNNLRKGEHNDNQGS